MYFEEQYHQADPYITALDVGSAALLLLEIGGGFAGYFIAVRRRSKTQSEA